MSKVVPNDLSIKGVIKKFSYLKGHLLNPCHWRVVAKGIRSLIIHIQWEDDQKHRIHDKITPEIRSEVTAIRRALKELTKLDKEVAGGMWSHWPDYGDHSDPLTAHKALIADCEELLQCEDSRDYAKTTGCLIVSTLDGLREEYTDIKLASSKSRKDPFIRLVQDVASLCYPGRDHTDNARNWTRDYKKTK